MQWVGSLVRLKQQTHNLCIEGSNPSRPIMKCIYSMAGGSHTIAKTFSIAVEHWMTRYLPQEEIPNDWPPFEIFVGKEHPAPYHSQFLVLVISIIERTFGISFHIPDCFLQPEWYQEITEQKQELYEEFCYQILKWLEDQGNIFDFKVEL